MQTWTFGEWNLSIPFTGSGIRRRRDEILNDPALSIPFTGSGTDGSVHIVVPSLDLPFQSLLRVLENKDR